MVTPEMIKAFEERTKRLGVEA
jgi:putative sterol carrier protein